MLRIVAAAAALAIGATVVLAQNAGVIEERRATMKAMDKATDAPGKMLKGEVAFDLNVVKAALKAVQQDAPKLKTLFPDDSKAGKTDALPAAFQNRADLAARFDRLVASAKAAERSIKDDASFKTEWAKLIAQCSSCHKKYVKP